MSQPHRVMLIAGGTGSIGREIAAQALGTGWTVIVHGSSTSSVDAVCGRLGVAFPGAPLQGIAADIRDDGAVERLVARAAQCHGRLDAVVDCLSTGPAGGKVVGPFDGTEPGAYLALMELSVVYLERLAFAALPWLKASRGCLIAFVSDAALFAAPRQTLIGAARAATVGFIRNFAVEVARDGVRAHCLSLGFVLETETAAKLEQAGSDRLEAARKRAGLGLPTPADIAPAVLFLCGDGARRMTGQVVSINGGLQA